MKWWMVVAAVTLVQEAGIAQPVHATTPGSFRSQKTAIAGDQPFGIEVRSNGDQDFLFTEGDELTAGKIFQGYYRVSVKSPGPWVLSVMARNDYLSPVGQDASSGMPAGVIAIRQRNDHSFTPLSTNPLRVLASGQKANGEAFYFDVKVDPSWQFNSGEYSGELVFVLSPE